MEIHTIWSLNRVSIYYSYCELEIIALFHQFADLHKVKQKQTIKENKKRKKEIKNKYERYISFFFLAYYVFLLMMIINFYSNEHIGQYI